MIASGRRRSRPKGTSTMLGRLMAGAQAVIAHADAGHAVFGGSDPPDLHGSQSLLLAWQQVAEATGSTVCVIDRAVHAVALAPAFDDDDWGLLGLRDDHAQAGLGSFEATAVATLDDGTKVERGPWQAARPEDPRHCVLVEPPEDKTWVDWGTPQVEAA